jgi:acetyl-CoA carboxylase biotin carboxylase subunit
MERILIANRGEIACRIIRSIQELGKQAITVYSEADADAPHRHLANVAYPIGPAPAPQSYLNTDAILQAAADSGAEAIHPGYGFLSEHAAFATQCGDAGIVFIGPSPATMQLMGNKAAARQLAQDAGVPVIPGSGQQPLDLETAHKQAAEIGYPVLLKAASGGGGIGIQAVTDPESLEKAFRTAQNRAKSAFGRADLYLEKYLVAPRHIEVQILGDTHGNLIHLYERECSIQRRHQKVIEEAPSFHLAQPARTGLRDRMTQAALAVAAAVQYTNAGTVEFLLDEKDGFYFIEMNTRLQVEHTVTEMTLGADLVAEQIRIAEGQPLSWNQDGLQLHGAAIECRLYAENPGKNFFPSPGQISALNLPSGPGIRIDSGIADGAQITPYYDPLLAKIIAHGCNRVAAIRRMQSALANTRIDGLYTNIALHQQIMDHPQFQAGAVDTDFLMRMLNP